MTSIAEFPDYVDRDSFVNKPDYRIEEAFDPEGMSIYFKIWRASLSPAWPLTAPLPILKKQENVLECSENIEIECFTRLDSSLAAAFTCSFPFYALFRPHSRSSRPYICDYAYFDRFDSLVRVRPPVIHGFW